MSAVDPITAEFSLPCPTHGTARVRLSRFRVLDRIPGAAHPAVYRVSFACPCGDDHLALVSHDVLDWNSLGLQVEQRFVNLMTARSCDLAEELASVTTARIGRGEWPWSFFCYLEGRPRPVTPSAFRLVASGERSVGVAVHCPVCGAVSVNLVSHTHLDVPFAHDRDVAVVPHVFAGDIVRTTGEFAAALASDDFDEQRLAW